MSGNDNEKPKSGGAYVPPHKRGQQAGKMPQQLKPHSQSPSHYQAHSHQNRQGGRQQGGTGGGRPSRSPASSPGRKKSNHNHHGNSNHNTNKNYYNKSKSPKRDNNSNRHHHHSPTRKEDLALQKQQMHVLQEAIDRICCINLDRRPDRWESFQQHLHQSLGKKMGHSLWHKVERTSAVDGIPEDLPVAELVESTWDASENAKWDRHIAPPMTKEMSPGEVGCALSHVKLWKELAVAAPKVKEEEGGGNVEREANMLILEDDSLFYSPKLAMNKAALGQGGRQQQQQQQQQQHDPHQHHLSIANHDFLTGFQLAWSVLPEDWDIWYLGFSDRGDRLPVDGFQLPKPHHHHHDKEHHLHHYPSMSIQMFRPTYGFHTHGYVLSAKAAKTLLDNMPVKGPLDVWLADNQWFGLKVYCSVVEGEGWKGTGAWLITQNRKPQQAKDSDIGMSGRKQPSAS
ncbi:glycosyl transferase-like protein [Seminavis robusta]|uniref:Glycosyl transferase-like protein n=1 Tax=Seminavis robusta TaxID=568900 RepID=A0A9N8ELZ3_9STRA|nr:glycosyl transferase-like protein [Seminavis robusta]|eukprot:Sro1151_g246740.1 glycosyl transferase-like protein (456) ;mRNA; r:11320-12687